jgi:hypothetical protein
VLGCRPPPFGQRWREGNQPLRWTATGLLEAEKKFKGYQEILLLKERLNPSRIQQKSLELGCRGAYSAKHRKPLQSTKTRTSSPGETN